MFDADLLCRRMGDPGGLEPYVVEERSVAEELCGCVLAVGDSADAVARPCDLASMVERLETLHRIRQSKPTYRLGSHRHNKDVLHS